MLIKSDLNTRDWEFKNNANTKWIDTNDDVWFVR